MVTQGSYRSNNKERRIAERRYWRNGFLASLFLHLMVFFLWWGEDLSQSPFAAAGQRSGDSRAASGGDMQAVSFKILPPRPIIPPRIPLPTVDPVFDVEMDTEFEMSSILGDRPGGDGPGIADEDGQGDGGNALEGLSGLVPPSPRGMIIPPANKSLKNQEVQIWVFVNETGRVVSDSTQLKPPTSDREFNDRLIREASEWIFEPAKKGGRAVSSWFSYKISMD